ncbi:protein of unknown function [Sporobacter termitidis DSM 10068]|uniref:Protein NO VEIN C-terminal domain-containing protein n=1 Tax=Sporobacter termitidis DSM 10068 TaxID=1123282 RepID=A0A1M5U2W0_9FIRM|nr:DUF3883 domain-containing protein [Sporobacter termitidis]SHH57201.1 protein of unknown function [Sporobacter termitidis DSM 10068]
MEKMALKKLTHSDLTFFKCYFSNQKEKPSKQKALNLNSDVFVDELYPELRKTTANTKLPVSLYIYGPGLKDAHVLQRKIVKSKGSKNWRLNGELIYSQETDPQRYDSLQPGDIALIGLDGDTIPSVVCIDFVAASLEVDKKLHHEFSSILTSGMQKIESDQLKEIVTRLDLPAPHPVYRFLLDEDLIAAVEGDAEAVLRVYKHSGNVMSSEELATSRQKAAYIGSMGEELVSQYFQQLINQGKLLDSEWVSRENAVAPYDFKITAADSAVSLLDVKSTSNKFETIFHISRAELITMANELEDYALYRVYDLTEYDAKLRIVSDMRQFAKELLEKLALLPDGISVDSISCSPGLFDFSDPIELHTEGDE